MAEFTPLFPHPQPASREEWDTMASPPPPEQTSETTYQHLSEVPLQTIYYDSHFPLNKGEFYINPGHAEEAFRKRLIDPAHDQIVGIQKDGERRPAHAAIIPIGKLDAKMTSLLAPLAPLVDSFHKLMVADKTIEKGRAIASSESVPPAYREQAKAYVAQLETLRNNKELQKVTGLVRLLYHEMNTHLQIPLTVSEFVIRANKLNEEEARKAEEARLAGLPVVPEAERPKHKPMITLENLDYKDASALFGIVEATKLILQRHPALLDLEVGKMLQERISIAESVIATLELTDPRRNFAATPLSPETTAPALAARAEAAALPDERTLSVVLDQS